MPEEPVGGSRFPWQSLKDSIWMSIVVLPGAAGFLPAALDAWAGRAATRARVAAAARAAITRRRRGPDADMVLLEGSERWPQPSPGGGWTEDPGRRFVRNGTPCVAA